jgi:hypothetical protein
MLKKSNDGGEKERKTEKRKNGEKEKRRSEKRKKTEKSGLKNQIIKLLVNMKNL